MSREKELYRENLLRLDNKFPDKEMFNITEVAKYCKLNYATAKNLFFEKNQRFISKTVFASKLS